MSLSARLTAHPLPFDPDRGADAWAALPAPPSEARDLIIGAAGSSPYLARLIGAEAAWLGEVLSEEPEASMAALITAARAAEGPETPATLRRLKARAALLIALADLGGVWSLETVTEALSDFADACVSAALATHLAAEIARGKLPGLTEDDLADGAGMVVLAMGKMGARELNYSSDIDLICLFDDDRFAADQVMEARASYIRATRRMSATLSDLTPQGYVFRTDLRLRPDSGVTPVCISIDAAERYYEAEGRTWERAAYIKARPAAGDIAAGARFLETLQPFVWRRHLDFASIHETHDMRQRIRTHKGLTRGTLEGRNIKLGPGGIREIEFFAQTRQLIAGGRDPGLRQRATKPALAQLAARGWIGERAARDLAAHYTALRMLEHRLQMIADAQTQSLPRGAEGFDRLARLSGHGDTGAFRAEIAARLRAVDGMCEPFFAPGRGQSAPAPEPELSPAAAEIVAGWPGYPALRSARGQEIFARLRPDLLTRFQRAARPEEALGNFDAFLRGLPAGVQLFALFEANPALVELIVDICATAPGLAQYLARNSAVLDAVIGGEFFAPWPRRVTLAESLAQATSGPDYEANLDAARLWQKEWHFRIGVHFLRRLIGAETAAAQYTALADCTLARIWDMAQAEVARRHGPPPGRGGAVVAMGSLGAGRLGATSDLDLIVIYDGAGQEASDGARPLAPRAWYAKATKTLIAGLSAPTAKGTLYEVDLRLRPSGRQGPVATAFAGFRNYQMEEAWTWEHLALTRARPLAGPADLCADIEAERQAVIAAKGDRARVLAATADMRARLRAAGRAGATFQPKDGPGGSQDIELLAQAATLIAGDPARDADAQIAAIAATGLATAQEAEDLRDALALFDRVGQAARLIGASPIDPEEIGRGQADFLARAAQASDLNRLAADLDLARAQAAAIIDRALPLGDQTRGTAGTKAEDRQR